MVTLVNQAAQVRQTSFLPLRNNMNPFVTSLIRHLLTSLGAAAAVKYDIDKDTIEVMVGGAAAAAGLGWSWWEKRQR